MSKTNTKQLLEDLKKRLEVKVNNNVVQTPKQEPKTQPQEVKKRELVLPPKKGSSSGNSGQARSLSVGKVQKNELINDIVEKTHSNEEQVKEMLMDVQKQHDEYVQRMNNNLKKINDLLLLKK